MITFKKTSDECIDSIQREKISTWFDLGLFLDRLKENNDFPAFSYSGSEKAFFKDLATKEIAFITFGYAVDGVTIEILKYIQSIKSLLNDPVIHLIGGEFKPESYKVLDKDFKKFMIHEASAFGAWPLYDSFFFTKHERGSKAYNTLILDFWHESKVIAKKLARYIEENNIGLLFLVNITSNPGNISLALATVLVSEIMGIAVINNCHDYYWEGGNRRVDLKLNRKKPGPRDFFFTNAHLGEIFSVIEVLFPWDSRSWITVNINKRQTAQVIKLNGHNPANVTEIGTAIDVHQYQTVSKRENLNTFYQFHQILSRYKNSLVAYSVNDVLSRHMVNPENPRPILIGYGKTRPVMHFMAENVIFLQPTRIIARKRIETGFRLISQMFRNVNFTEKFKQTENLKITIIVTGPVATGHFAYFNKLIERFQFFLDSLKPNFRDKVFIAFLFSELDKDKFKKKFKNPVGIPELYKVSSLILLPSETEGRGLPIIEAAAAGKPIFCRRYFPELVYSEVIGENLTEENRLKVIEYNGKKISKKQTKTIIQRVFFPQLYSDEILHNIKVVEQRFSAARLTENIKQIFKKLYYQTREKENKKSISYVTSALENYRETFDTNNQYFRDLIKNDHREFLAGYHRLGFMIYLKSLIDPSAFRKEEQEMEGMLHQFALEMLDTNKNKEKLSEEKKSEFYNAVDDLLKIRKGEIEIRHDHSMAYRHRNKYFYPYRDYTYQELTGLINILYHNIIRPRYQEEIILETHFFTDWNLSLAQLTCSNALAIDNRGILMKKMKENIPLVLFPGTQYLFSLEFFALQAIRARIGLPLEKELKEKHLEKVSDNLAPVYVFLQKYPVQKWVSKTTLEKFVKTGDDKELYLLYKHKLLRFVETNQWTVGIHFAQLGEDALRIINTVKKQNGLLITDRVDASMMTDIVDIDRIHISKAENPLMSNILGIPQGSGFVQFVPAGIRATIAYPTPVQTAKDFNELRQGDIYKELVEEMGEKRVSQLIKNDAEEKGSPLFHILNDLYKEKKKNSNTEKVSITYLSGKYKDGKPWNGVMARTKSVSGKKWRFKVLYRKEGTEKVTDFVDKYESINKSKIEIAWNGGYILNPELVGKLGISESYIGSPLGLLIYSKKVISTPLFNKPALLVNEKGKFEIRRVNVRNGMGIKLKSKVLKFPAKNYNQITFKHQPAYYDLMEEKQYLIGRGRVMVRIAGNTVKEIFYTGEKEKIRRIPVGLTLSFPAAHFPEEIKVNVQLDFSLPGLEDITDAVEAGPMLIEKGKICLDMAVEGWKKKYSIQTQAARLDYTDMRGPKIAAGIDDEGNIMVLAINGRIRESVGATHYDMAEILLQNRAKQAMGFDPGGSSTLVVDNRVINISPYNHLYEENVYSLPPEPRAVANTVIGYVV